MTVYAVVYDMGEPAGHSNIVFCATQARAENEILRLVYEKGYEIEQLFVQEFEVLE